MPLMDQTAPPQTGEPQVAEEQSDAAVFHNPLLGKAEQAIEKNLTPQNRDDYMKIVAAGMKIVLHGGPTGLITKLTQSKDPMATATAGPVNLVTTLAKSLTPQQGHMPEKAMVPAAMTLMFHALDVLDHQGILKVDETVLEQAVKKISDNLFRAFNISNEQLQKMATQTHQAVTAPGGIEKLHAHAQQVVARHSGAPQAPAAPPPGGPAPLMQ